MKRNPNEERKKYYFKHLSFRQFTPHIFYYKCAKCGNEFKHERMYGCDTTLFGYNGCPECFTSLQEFRDWLEVKGMVLTEEDFK